MYYSDNVYFFIVLFLYICLLWSRVKWQQLLYNFRLLTSRWAILSTMRILFWCMFYCYVISSMLRVLSSSSIFYGIYGRWPPSRTFYGLPIFIYFFYACSSYSRQLPYNVLRLRGYWISVFHANKLLIHENPSRKIRSEGNVS